MIAPAPRSSRSAADAVVSVVLPVFNEVAVLQQLADCLKKKLIGGCRRLEVVFINDGSTDGSREKLDELADLDHRIVVVHLARNFGHQPALHAGLEHASGDVVVVMDSDMQDDPAAIVDFLSEWEAGHDVVYAQRTKRKESAPKRFLFYSFYRILNSIADSPMPEDAGNFGLMDRSVVDALLKMQERERYFPGLRSWTGFRQTGIPVERLARHDDEPRVSLKGLFKLAKTAVFAFSSFPLTLFYILAGSSAVVCAAATLFVMYHKAFTGLAIPGWTSGIILASFFGALNAFGICVLGEYVIRIYDQVRQRPIYVAQQIRNNPEDKTESGLQQLDTVLQQVDEQIQQHHRSTGRHVGPIISSESQNP